MDARPTVTPLPGALTPLALRARLRVARLQHLGLALPRLLPPQAVHVLGLSFASPVLLAAGFDRRGALFDAASALGFGAIENGSFTCCDGPVSPVLQRWPRKRALIRGISLRLAAGPLGAARENCLRWLVALHRHADYFTLNPGSHRNAPDAIAALTEEAARRLTSLAYGSPPALVVKLAADGASPRELREQARRLIDAGAQGLLLSHETSPAVLDCIATVAAVCPGSALISVGGLRDAVQMRQRLAAGADLVQLHRALTGDPLRACQRLRS
jgi:dihydroorotate dehydrogenase